MKKALFSLLFFAGIPAFAFDPILLQCVLTGTKTYAGEKEQKFSETIEIDVSSMTNEVVFDLNGPTISGNYLGNSYTMQDGTRVKARNVDSPSEWLFTRHTWWSDGRIQSESGRIDRRTGSISYSEAATMTVSPKRMFYLSAAGTCSKQSNAKKF